MSAVLSRRTQLAAALAAGAGHRAAFAAEAAPARIASLGGAVTEILYRLGGAPRIVVVEPEAAPALIDSIRAGRVIDTDGPVSSMGRLDCKTPSMIALAGLARDADLFVTITEAEAAAGVAALGRAGFATTPSGAAGVAALLTGAVGVADHAAPPPAVRRYAAPQAFASSRTRRM